MYGTPSVSAADQMQDGLKKKMADLISEDNATKNFENVQESLSFSEKRSKLRLETTISEKLRISLQTCKASENEEKLEGLLAFHRKNKLTLKCRILEGLLYILRQLLASFEGSKAFGYLSFNEAHGIFCSFMEREVEDKEFRDHLLHEDYGLSVYVATVLENRYILLQNDTVDTGKFLLELERLLSNDQENFSRFDLNAETLKRVINSMDTEYDKSVLKAMIFTSASRKKVYELGIKPENAVGFLNKVVTASTECERATEAADDIIKLRDKEKLKSFDGKISLIEEKLHKNESLLSERQRADLVSEKSSLEARREWIEKDLNQCDSQSVRRFDQRKRRLAKTLIHENRVKRRRLGAGAKKSLDTEDEEFIAGAIEEKSTAHGRRHDTVLYSNHRVKKRDFLSLANYSLYRRGRKLIKSATTVLNRGRPKNIKSRAAKAHCGKALFCSKKPPKTESESGLATHHQRAHIRNCKLDMFKAGSNKTRSLMISFDDKAYIRPGSDVGARIVKKGVIYDVSDPSKQKRLPQHDFSETKVHQTPSSFRFIKGCVEDIDGEHKFVHEEDQTIVTVRPKAYIGSAGSVWASDLLKIKWEVPQLFEQSVESAYGYPLTLRKFCHRVHDILFYFQDCTMKSDVMCVTTIQDCKFKAYEMKKLNWLNTRLSEAVESFQEEKGNLTRTNDIANGTELLGLINDIKEVNDTLINDDTNNANCLWAHLEKVNSLCKATVTFIDNLQLPPLCDYILQATDAGPGVGVSNVEVKYRDIEMSRINGWTHMNRIHRAPHDSGQNEAERSNAAIGEALVDGGALKWEYFKPTDILSEEEIKKLTVAEIKELEAETMERNAWQVSQDVVSRIDGEPGPAGDCMKAFVTNKKDRQFFFNTEYLNAYNAGKSEKKREQVPGHHYFQKLDNLSTTRMTSGEMFHEYCFDQSVPPTPRPVPDTSKLPKHHYLPLEDTPTLKENGDRREADDFHPRACLKPLHKEKAIDASDAASLQAFCNKYIVEENLVQTYLQHLNHLQMMNEKRKIENKENNSQENRKSCKDFDWQKMLNDGTLAKQRVCILDKYIDYYHLSEVRNKNKPEKVDAIIHHLRNAHLNNSSESDEDLVLGEIGESSDDQTDQESESD